LNDASAKIDPNETLKAAGYKFHSTFGINALYIDEPLFSHYFQKHKEGT
jgi:hypothetical protein